ncbi:12139_t:CDS:2 [Dentiscutata erythropus]|uniref:12139_t:CDS:1 n=1 Tax=Dentiscutata erythropus TaxID=1348616 RepID=A0A9N9AQD6_9GLOM|nr:12139_t:CDS:2 [Dentiscutata erythropus]
MTKGISRSEVQRIFEKHYERVTATKLRGQQLLRSIKNQNQITNEHQEQKKNLISDRQKKKNTSGTSKRKMEDQKSVVLLMKIIVEIMDKLVKDVKSLQVEQQHLKH